MMIKILVGLPAPHVRGTRVESWLQPFFWLPTNAYSYRQQVPGQAFGLLPLKSKTGVEFLAPSISPTQSQLVEAFGD